MNIEMLVKDMPYNNKKISLALISKKYDMIVYFFDKLHKEDLKDDYDSITAIIVNTTDRCFDITMPYINQLNMYYGDFEKFESGFIGKHYKKVINHYQNN